MHTISSILLSLSGLALTQSLDWQSEFEKAGYLAGNQLVSSLHDDEGKYIPSRATGLLEVAFTKRGVWSSAGYSPCTAWLVGYYEVMTAAHCLKFERESDSQQDIYDIVRATVSFDYEGVNFNRKIYDVATVVEKDEDSDYAILRLSPVEHAFPPGEIFGFYRVPKSTPTLEQYNFGNFYHHPFGFFKLVTISAECKFFGTTTNSKRGLRWRHKCYTGGGSSGAPFVSTAQVWTDQFNKGEFIRDDKFKVALAMHVESEPGQLDPNNLKKFGNAVDLSGLVRSAVGSAPISSFLSSVACDITTEPEMLSDGASAPTTNYAFLCPGIVRVTYSLEADNAASFWTPKNLNTLDTFTDAVLGQMTDLDQQKNEAPEQFSELNSPYKITLACNDNSHDILSDISARVSESINMKNSNNLPFMADNSLTLKSVPILNSHIACELSYENFEGTEE